MAWPDDVIEGPRPCSEPVAAHLTARHKKHMNMAAWVAVLLAASPSPSRSKHTAVWAERINAFFDHHH